MNNNQNQNNYNQNQNNYNPNLNKDNKSRFSTPITLINQYSQGQLKMPLMPNNVTSKYIKIY